MDPPRGGRDLAGGSFHTCDHPSKRIGHAGGGRCSLATAGGTYSLAGAGTSFPGKRYGASVIGPGADGEDHRRFLWVGGAGRWHRHRAGSGRCRPRGVRSARNCRTWSPLPGCSLLFGGRAIKSVLKSLKPAAGERGGITIIDLWRFAATQWAILMAIAALVMSLVRTKDQQLWSESIRVVMFYVPCWWACCRNRDDGGRHFIVERHAAGGGVRAR